MEGILAGARVLEAGGPLTHCAAAPVRTCTPAVHVPPFGRRRRPRGGACTSSEGEP